jgi:uncharacterized protein (TIGR03067 family)
MKAYWLGLFLLMSAVSAPSDAQPADVDLKGLQGEWVVVEHRPVGEPKITYEKMLVKDDKLTLYSVLGNQHGSREFAIKLSPKASPKRIDFAPGTGKEFFGLYQFKDGMLKICYRGPGATRPKDFDDLTDGTIATTFLVFKQKK